MRYNTVEAMDNFKSLMRIIAGDATEASKTAKFEATTEELEVLYRTCELIEGWAEQARITLGKLMDEREDITNLIITVFLSLSRIISIFITSPRFFSKSCF